MLFIEGRVKCCSLFLQADHVADTLVLDLRDEQSYYLESLYSLLGQYQWEGCWNNNQVPPPIMMYQRYMETYPDKLEELCYHSKEVGWSNLSKVGTIALK